MITNAAMKCGFSGGLIIDFPNSSKAKKIYLVIDAGYTGTPEIVMMDGLKDANDEGNEGENEEKKIEVHDNKAEKYEILKWLSIYIYIQLLELNLFLFKE